MNGLCDLFKFQIMSQVNNWIDTPFGNVDIGEFQVKCIGDHCD